MRSFDMPAYFDALYCDSQIKQMAAVKFSFKYYKNASEIYENISKSFHKKHITVYLYLAIFE